MMARLKDICTVNPKSPRFQDELIVSFVPMPKVGENGEFDPSEVKTYQEVKKGFTYFQNDDVLFAKITPCMENGKGAIAQSLKNGIGFGSTEFHVLRPIPEYVTSKWLFYLLSWPGFRKEAEKNMTGSAGQKRVPKSFLEKYTVDVPDLGTQEKITNILDKICGLIFLHKQQLAKLDELVKARFVEMFGDPVNNGYHWRTITFKASALRLSDGPFGSNLKSEHYVSSGIRVIRLGNIGVGKFIDEDKSFVSREHYERLKKYTCKPGEMVIGTLGDPNLRACIIPQYVGIALNKADCVHYIPRNDILLPEFVCQYINCPETLILASGMIHGQTRNRISSRQIAQLPIFVPPVDLQERFSDFANKVNQQRLTIQQSLDKLEVLKKSLMQEYFG